MWNWLKRRKNERLRVRIEDALKHLHALQWGGQTASIDSLRGALGLSYRQALRLYQQMQADGFVRTTNEGLKLTPNGEGLALQVIRAHRLWETYLADDARLPFARLHSEADRREHKRTDESLRAMEVAMGFPATDPHGDPIPTEQGQLLDRPATPLNEWPVSEPALVTHIEDEPAQAFAQVVATGLRPGCLLTIISSDDERIELTDGRESIVLAPVVAANVHVTKAPSRRKQPPAAVRLSELPTGRSAIIESLESELRGLSRRRLLDLGLTPGATITAEYRAISGDPGSYRIRGALIALRRDQSRHILVQPMPRESSFSTVSGGAA